MAFKNFKVISFFIFAIYLPGCAATQVAIEHRNLDVQTKMSETIFLDPVKDDLKTLYLDIKNTSDKEVKVIEAVKTAVTGRGYHIVSDPEKAHYMLQANILQVGKIDPSAASMMLNNGFGGAVVGGAIGAVGTRRAEGLIGGAVIGGLGEMVANSMVKDVTYSIITDLLISERSKGVVKQNTDSSLSQGTSTLVKQSEAVETNWKRYRTRIVSTANKVNLKFEEAIPELESSLARSVSGIF